MAIRLAHDFVGGLHRFHHLADFAHCILQRLTTTQGQAQAAITRQVTGAGQYQVAQAGQAHQGFGTSADGGGQAQHFVQATGDQAGAGVESQLHAVGHAGRNRQHVLHGAAQFRAQHVVAGVGAEGRAVKDVGDLLGELGVVAMHGHGRGQAQSDFLGEGRAGDDSQRYGRAEDVFRHFMQETPGPRLEALGRPRHAGGGRPQRCQQAQGLGEGVRRHHDQYQVRTLHRGGEVGGGTQGVRQGDAGQVTGVFVLPVDGRRDGGVATPQRDRMTVARHQGRQCGAPGTRAEYRDIQGMRHASALVVERFPRGRGKAGMGREPAHISVLPRPRGRWCRIRRCRPARRWPARPRRPGPRVGARFPCTGRRS